MQPNLTSHQSLGLQESMLGLANPRSCTPFLSWKRLSAEGGKVMITQRKFRYVAMKRGNGCFVTDTAVLQ